MISFLLQITSIKNDMKPGKLVHIVFFITLLFSQSCNDNDKSSKPGTSISNLPAGRNKNVQEVIRSLVVAEDRSREKMDDLTHLFSHPVLGYYYHKTEYQPVWSSQQKWKPYADSLLNYLAGSTADGLFPEHYHYPAIKDLKLLLERDSSKTNDAGLWARADVLFSDAFFHVLQDLKQGRLQPDSLEWKHNKVKQEEFFSNYLNRLLSGDSISSITRILQPALKEYVALKNSLPVFLDSMDEKSYTYLRYPYKDSLAFLGALLKRFAESGFFNGKPSALDSAALSQLLTRYQVKAGLKQTGKLSAALVNTLNNTDREKFKRIAITLDKYKKLPPRLPEKYIWVNLPSFKLQVWENDSIAMESKVIIGKPGTPTPHISSHISDLVIFPTWTVPNSIITKELLPGLKKNPGYLGRKGLALYSNDGDEVDPYSVDWFRYTKGIPYFVRQASGDNNALGVIKFNFKNPYSVYLHDTNQRYLFKNKMRSLSHGCVRVEDWKKLAFYIARNDSLYYPQRDSFNFNTDSIITWIARKEKHVVPVKKQIPIFILYFGCEGAKGTVRFYDDVYGEDKILRERFFAHK
jgi:murein L,D-transpeptidase YcbB/YkuD